MDTKNKTGFESRNYLLYTARTFICRRNDPFCQGIGLLVQLALGEALVPPDLLGDILGDVNGDVNGDTSGDTLGDIEALGEGDDAGGPQATSRNARAMTITSNVRIMDFFIIESPLLLYAPFPSPLCIIITWDYHPKAFHFGFAQVHFPLFTVAEPYHVPNDYRYPAVGG